MKTQLVFVLLVALSSTCHKVVAQTWDELTPEQQSQLDNLQTQWNVIDESRRISILQGLVRWQLLDESGKSDAKARFERWQQLTEKDKIDLQRQFQTFQDLDDDRKEELRSLYRIFRELPAEQQQRLRADFEWGNVRSGSTGDDKPDVTDSDIRRQSDETSIDRNSEPTQGQRRGEDSSKSDGIGSKRQERGGDGGTDKNSNSQSETGGGASQSREGRR